MTHDDGGCDVAEAKRRKLYGSAKEIGLTRSDRIDLAQYLLRRDITSWTQLTAAQVDRLLDALEGFVLVGYLLASHGGEEIADGGVTQAPGGDPDVGGVDLAGVTGGVAGLGVEEQPLP